MSQEVEVATSAAPAAPAPSWISQATAVEQSRAVAEVQAAIVVAQQCPRSMTEALRQMRESCEQYGLAERAFFRYNRAGSQITGPTVHLARELARCWGNVQYGLTELRRDDEGGLSEMQAFAWDVQTNTRATTTFVVPHARDAKGERKPLVELRDVYENNANQGSRRVREQIFAILPRWFVEEAVDACNATLQRGRDASGKSIAQQAVDLVQSFDSLRVSRDQLEQKVGAPLDKWAPHDLATLRIIGKSISRSEVSVEDEFPPLRVTVDEIEAKS